MYVQNRFRCPPTRRTSHAPSELSQLAITRPRPTRISKRWSRSSARHSRRAAGREPPLRPGLERATPVYLVARLDGEPVACGFVGRGTPFAEAISRSCPRAAASGSAPRFSPRSRAGRAGSARRSSRARCARSTSSRGRSSSSEGSSRSAPRRRSCSSWRESIRPRWSRRTESGSSPAWRSLTGLQEMYAVASGRPGHPGLDRQADVRGVARARDRQAEPPAGPLLPRARRRRGRRLRGSAGRRRQGLSRPDGDPPRLAGTGVATAPQARRDRGGQAGRLRAPAHRERGAERADAPAERETGLRSRARAGAPWSCAGRSRSAPRTIAGMATTDRRETDSGIEVKPVYTADDVAGLELELPGRVPVHARALPGHVPRPAVDDPPVRGLRLGRGDERALPLPARARPDRALGRVRPADAARLRLGRPARGRRGRADRRRDRLARRHGAPASTGSRSARSRPR